MTTDFIAIETATATADAVTVVTPEHEEGDLLVFTLLVGAVVAEAATLTVPTGWTLDGSETASTVRVLKAFKYAEADEDLQYTFGYTAVRPLIGAIQSVRGAARDYDYDTLLYPNGYYAPEGSAGTSATATSTTIAPAAIATTVPNYTRALYLFAQYDSLSGTPILDDVSPLIAMRAKLQTPELSVVYMDEVYEAPVAPAPTYTIKSSLNKRWLGVATTVESFESTPESVDNYKSKLLRRTMPSPPYDTRLSSNLGKLLAVIGTSDNDIGGLFGADDFLPDESP